MWRIFDLLIPRDLQEFDHHEILYKARALVSVLLVGGVNQIANTLVLFALRHRSPSIDAIAMVSTMIAVGLFAILWLFRRTGSFVLVANLYGLIATLSTLCLIMVSGGFQHSPLLPWWPLIVIFTFIMAGWRTAACWGLVGMMLWLWGSKLDEAYYVSIFSHDTLAQSYRFSTVLAGGALLMVMWFFDFFQRQLLGRLQVERDRALFSAAHDPLTGLANRKTFEQRLEHVLAHKLGDESVDGVLIIDLDGFKEVNDSLGHQAGDAVLMAIAERLRCNVRHSDLAARLGGDEFAVLLRGLRAPGDLDIIVGHLHRAISAPIELAEGPAVAVGASIGVALVSGDGDDLESLLHNADQAMYHAKSRARPFVFFHDIAAPSPP
ncbi:MAG: GGDEF domain-containing protein [Porticoccaceae bacterium]